jgi:hypothetical protein
MVQFQDNHCGRCSVDWNLIALRGLSYLRTQVVIEFMVPLLTFALILWNVEHDRAKTRKVYWVRNTFCADFESAGLLAYCQSRLTWPDFL